MRFHGELVTSWEMKSSLFHVLLLEVQEKGQLEKADHIMI